MPIRPEDHADDDVDLPPAHNPGRHSPVPPAKPATLPQTSAGPRTLAFGSVGQSNKSADSGSFFVARRVDGGTTYSAAPLAFVWSPDGPNRWRMGPFEGDPSFEFLSLEELAKKLHALREEGRGPKLEQQLLLLDAAGAKLLDTLDTLHARGWSAGLLHNGNILLHTKHGKLENVVLPDLGFYYDPEMAGTPAWIENYPAKGLLAAPDDPSKRQKAWKVEPKAIADDLKLVVGLLSAALLGKADGRASSSGHGPWAAFEAVRSGAIADAATLKARLDVEGNRLSDAFRVPPPRPEPARTPAAIAVSPPKSPALPILISGSLLSLVGLVLYFADPFDWQADLPAPTRVASLDPIPSKAEVPPKVEPPAAIPKVVPETKPEPKPVDKLTEPTVLAAADKVSTAAPEARAKALRDLVEKMEGRESTPEGGDLLEKPRTAYLDGWIGRYKDADRGTIDREMWPAIVEKLRAIELELLDILKVLPPGSESQKKREAACLEAAKVRIRELQK